jgi:hypothetical protein
MYIEEKMNSKKCKYSFAVNCKYNKQEITSLSHSKWERNRDKFLTGIYA